ncbi:MAG: PrgI family protein [Kribbellaceae bacterium]|nr:PrgI family protein [Kribbellaceae bacterium]
MSNALSARFPRPQRNALLLGLRPIQLALVAVGIVVALASLLAGWPAALRLAGATTAVVCTIIAFGRFEGLPAHRWIVLRAAHVIRRWRRNQSYRANVMTPRRHGLLQLPGEASSLRILDTRSSIGAVHDPLRRRLIAVARIEGPAHLLQNSDEQDRRVAAYGRMIAGLCQSNRIAHAQILERTIPDPGDGLGDWARKRGLDASTATGAIYRDLLQHAAPAAARHETLFSFALNLDSVSKEVRKYGGGLAGAMAVLDSESRGFQTSFAAAGVSGVWLNAADLAGSLRVAFDPAATRTLVADFDPADAAPLAVEATWDLLRTDSSFHRVYVVTEWPRIRATPSFLSPLLLRPGIRRTFSLVLQPVPIGKALRDARRHQVERVTDRATRKRVGQLETEEDRQLDADVAQREKDLAAGHGDVRWIGLIAVSADTEDALDEACTEIEIAASQALLDVRRLVGQQVEGFLAAALPFGVGLG